MLEYLKSLWTKILSLFKPAPDPRPDPEDPVVYAHLERLLWSFEDAGGPFQLLRDTAKKPTDVAKAWADLKEQGKQGPPPVPAGYACWVDVYDGPLGAGLVVNYETTRKGVAFRKAINLGPEEYREQDWAEVVEKEA